MYVCQLCKEIITNKIFSLIPLNMAFCDRSQPSNSFSTRFSLSCQTIENVKRRSAICTCCLFIDFIRILFYDIFLLALSSFSSSFLSLVLSYLHDIFPIHTIDC